MERGQSPLLLETNTHNDVTTSLSEHGVAHFLYPLYSDLTGITAPVPSST